MNAGCDDGSCTYAPCIANDVPGGAVALMVTPLGTCNPMMADLTGASDSPESSNSGADLWYAVTAVTPGLRIEVLDVNPQDLKIDLLDAALNAVDAENVVAGNGGEALNYGDLTTGATYYISVSGSTGAFSICAQWIQDSQCDYGSGPYDLCATFKSDWIGAAGYAFEFTSSSMVTYSYEKAAALQPSTFVKLSDAGLLWGDTYSVNCIAFYNLTNGAGVEKVYVQSDNVCSITVNPAPTMVLRPSDNCANFGPHLLGQTIAGQPFVCGAIDYEWEFTRTDVVELPIYKLRGAPNRFIQLLTIPGLVAGGTYDVRVRPIFTSGPGSFGAIDCISIVGAVGMTAQDGPVNEMEVEKLEVSGIEAGLYPNPNTGSMININLTGVTSEVVNVDVLDQAGRVVFAGQYTVNNGSLNGTITFDQQLAGGVYMMKFTMDGESRTERFVVTR
jgi:Secretion system C-terminal sorting domain